MVSLQLDHFLSQVVCFFLKESKTADDLSPDMPAAKHKSCRYRAGFTHDPGSPR